MKHRLINTLSVIIGRLFAASYKLGMPTWLLTDRLLQSYIGLRRKLPRATTLSTAGGGWDFRHIGNHFGSDKAPYRATQGMRPRRGISSGV